MKVPVRNVYYMLLYAWRLIRPREAVDVAQEGETRLQDLFAHVLADTVAELLSRGLDRGYVTRDETVPGIRGRLEWADTVKRSLLPAGRAHCRFDELEYDVLHNRILKATLGKLLHAGLHEHNRSRVASLYRRLDAVADAEITVHDFRRVQVHRNNAPYEYAMRLCELIHDNLMVDPRTGRTRFREYQESEQEMGRLFEQFVGAFFERHRPLFRRAETRDVRWSVTASRADRDRLPRMIADVVLEGQGRRIIIDTKFYARSFSGSGARRKVISDHLYQILAYVLNRDAQIPGPPHEGMLLYPVVQARFRFEYVILDHRITVCSVDLDQPWETIESDLLAVLEPAPGAIPLSAVP